MYANDVGTAIKIDTGENIVGALAVEIHYKKKDKTTGVWAGTVSGTQIIEYLTQEGDVLTKDLGTLRVQGFVTLTASEKFHTEIGEIPVLPSLIETTL